MLVGLRWGCTRLRSPTRRVSAANLASCHALVESYRGSTLDRVRPDALVRPPVTRRSNRVDRGIRDEGGRSSRDRTLDHNRSPLRRCRKGSWLLGQGQCRKGSFLLWDEGCRWWRRWESKSPPLGETDRGHVTSTCPLSVSPTIGNFVTKVVFGRLAQALASLGSLPTCCQIKGNAGGGGCC